MNLAAIFEAMAGANPPAMPPTRSFAPGLEALLGIQGTPPPPPPTSHPAATGGMDEDPYLSRAEDLFGRAEQTRNQAYGLKSPEPTQMAFRTPDLAPLLLALLAGDQGGSVLQGYIGGKAQKAEQDTQRAQYDFQMRQRAMLQQAEGLDNQGQRLGQRAERAYRIRQDAAKLLQDQTQFDTKLKADRELEELRQKGRGELQDDKQAAKEKDEAWKALRDPKTTGIARDDAIATLSRHGINFTPSQLEEYKKSTYYEDNVRAKTGKANAETKLIGARTQTEDQTRPYKVANLIKEGKVKDARVQHMQADTAYRKIVAKWYPKDKQSQILARSQSANNAARRLEMAEDHFGKMMDWRYSSLSARDDKALLDMDADIDKLQSELEFTDNVIAALEQAEKDPNKTEEVRNDATSALIEKRASKVYLQSRIDRSMLLKQKVEAAREESMKASGRPSVEKPAGASSPANIRVRDNGGPLRPFNPLKGDITPLGTKRRA